MQTIQLDMKKAILLVAAAMGLAALPISAETIVDVTGSGAEKITVSVQVANNAYAKCLTKNLEISGAFKVVPGDAAIKVSGTPGVNVTASGRGQSVNQSGVQVTDDKSARMAARQFANEVCKAFAGQKGFATDKVAFVTRRGANNADVCVCYPDGYDIKQVTGDGKAAVGPRWKNDNTIFYTGYKGGGPEIWSIDTMSGQRRKVWGFKGLTTGAVVSPDGRRVAIILSVQGNPDLYVIDIASKQYRRLTNTPTASEGQPSWSPDGRQIVYVSNERRTPQLFVIDLATGKKRCLTTKGSQNVDPDWGPDGRIAYITKRGGSRIATIDPNVGEPSVKLITDAGSWEHPSWSRDMRHLVAGRDKALWIVDTMDGGDKPRAMFVANGNWINPAWSR